ncbi:MAG: DUF4234 domain-containing protein [Bacteroidales bacterium]|nr:DUF4234 domain-containing protein [Bacteroidales bacterium]
MEVIQNTPPTLQLPTSRGLVKIFFLGLITFGIYPLVIYSKISTEINTVASKYDGQHTMHYCLVYFIFSWLTLGIVPLVWSHRISARIGRELARRGIQYDFGASDFWLWHVLGSLIIVGPFIYIHKFMHAMNHLNADYNQKG